jgi:hypothetical protein
MDLSKLPKLSQTPTGPPANDPDVLPAIPYATPTPQPGIGPDIWFNTIMGIIAIFLGKTFAAYVFARLTGQVFHTGIFWTDGPLNGQEVAYPDLMGHQMLSDAGVFVFGLVILLEVLVRILLARRWHVPRTFVGLVWMAAMISTGFNVYVCIKFFQDGSIPITSGLAAAFGGFIIADMRRAMKSSGKV